MLMVAQRPVLGGSKDRIAGVPEKHINLIEPMFRRAGTRPIPRWALKGHDLFNVEVKVSNS
jgi:hypothetical protein